MPRSFKQFLPVRSSNQNTAGISYLSYSCYMPCLYYVGLCHHGMACPWVAVGGESLQMSQVAVHILNKQSQIANGGVVLLVGGWVRG